MALEDFLKTLRGASQDVGAGAETLRGIQQQQNLRQFAADVPGLLAHQDFSQVAGRALEAGLPTITQGIISGQIDIEQARQAALAKQKEDKPLDELIIKQAESQYGTVIPRDKPGSVQKAFIEQLEKQRAQGLKQEEFNLQKGEAGRREEEALQKARVDFTKDVQQKFGKKFDAIDKLNALDSFPLESAAAVQALISNIVKTIGADAGALSRQDIESYIPRTAGGDLAQLQNYLTNQGDSPLPDDVKAGLKALLQNSRNSAVKNNQARAKKDIKAAIEARRGRVIRNGQIDPAILTEASKFDLGVKVGNNGEVIVDTFENLSTPTGKKSAVTLPQGQTTGIGLSDFKAPAFQNVANKIINDANLTAEQKQEKLKLLKSQEK